MSADERADLEKHVDMERVLEVLKKENVIRSNATWNSVQFFHPKEGPEDDGYKGRIGIHEVLHISPAIKEIVMASGTSDAIEAQARKEVTVHSKVKRH